MLHQHPPGRHFGVARIAQPDSIATEDLERTAEHLARDDLDVVRSLHRAVDAVHGLEKPQVRAMLSLGALQFGDVAVDAPIADEAAEIIEYRDAGCRDVAHAARGRGMRDLEIPERQVRIERGPMLTPALFIGLEIGNFPSSLAELGAARRRIAHTFGKILASEAMLCVRLPISVEGELNQGAEALLARAQCAGDTAAPGAELSEEHAERDEVEERERVLRRQSEVGNEVAR